MRLRSLRRSVLVAVLAAIPLVPPPAGAADPDWVERWASPDVRRESGADVVTDAEGNLYVCATTEFAQLVTADVLVLSHDPDGALRWSDVYDSGGQDLAVALVTAALTCALACTLAACAPEQDAERGAGGVVITCSLSP